MIKIWNTGIVSVMSIMWMEIYIYIVMNNMSNWYDILT